jgi:hypothetical protein
MTVDVMITPERSGNGKAPPSIGKLAPGDDPPKPAPAHP